MNAKKKQTKTLFLYLRINQLLIRCIAVVTSEPSPHPLTPTSTNTETPVHSQQGMAKVATSMTTMSPSQGIAHKVGGAAMLPEGAISALLQEQCRQGSSAEPEHCYTN